MCTSFIRTHRKTIAHMAACLVCALWVVQGSAQQVILNTVGERIVIYPDGSWRYYEDADSVLLDMQLMKEDVLLEDDHTEDVFTAPGHDAGAIEDQLRLAIRFAEHTAKAAHEANIVLSEETNSMFELDAQLRQAQENKNLVEADRVATLEDALKEQRMAVKEARKHLKTLEKYADKAQDVVDKPPQRRAKALNKLMVKYNAYAASAPVGTPAVRQPKVKAPANTSKPPARSPVSGGVPARITYSGVETQRLQEYTRKPASCRLIEKRVDDRNKPVKLVVERATLFTHTDDELRPYFRQQELITASGQLTQIDDQVFFSVEFSIASPNARKNFGSLERGSLLRLRLLDNIDIDLYNMRADRGQIDPYTGNTRFAGQYLLEKGVLKALERSEVDKMRVVWSAGYEDYEIYEVDFFIHQLNCLNSF